LDHVLDFVVRLCIDLYLRDALHKIFQKIEVRRAGRQDLLLSCLPQVLLQEFLCPLAVISVGAVLLLDILVISGYLVHPRFDLSLQNIYKLVSVHPEALDEDVGWHDVALVGHDAEDYYQGVEEMG